MKPFKIEEESYYQDIGFKCGLEIHAQLTTERKLFCRCPAAYRNDPPDASILRHMRPTLSELGEYDRTALMEFKTKKDVIYQLYRDTICTYEMDDTPPFPINRNALEISVRIGSMLGMNVVDEFHVSRKQYLDGSIPTGFQRTGIIAVDGAVTLPTGRTITLSHLCLEEDACREISDVGHTIVFRTDRLSTPLVEVITNPDIHSPQEVVTTAWRIAHLLRATGGVRRGMGAVRQDVNVSIRGGRRIEIKGVPRIPLFPYLVHCEAMRQRELLAVMEELKKRGVTAETIESERTDITDLFAGSNHPVLAPAAAEGKHIVALKIAGWRGILAWTIQPDVPFARDFAGRVRVIACLDRPPILYHTDDPDTCGFTETQWHALRERLHLGENDLGIIVWGPEADTRTAVDELLIRAREACTEIPPETRQALDDGTTDFERVLPGADRMYPDTDTPPVVIDPDWVDAIQAALPPDPKDIEEELVKAGLQADPAHRLSLTYRPDLMKTAVAEQLDLTILSHILLNLIPALKRCGIETRAITDTVIAEILRRAKAGEVIREILPDLLHDVVEKGAAVLDSPMGKAPETAEANRLIREALEAYPAFNGERLRRAVIGYVMKRVKRKIPGRLVDQIYREVTANE